jgi:hypothetical protein
MQKTRGEKMKKTMLFVYVVVLGLVDACAQQIDFTRLKGPYLGQIPPGSTPKVFAPGVVSTEKGWEAALSFSPDMSELFFTFRPDIEGTENRIMHMQKINNVWTKPKLASFAQDIMEFESFITPDYKKVIFQSKRSNPSGKVGIGGVWYSQKEGGVWKDAEYVPGPINEGWIMSVTSTLDGTLYFTGAYNKNYGIYRSHFINGEYANPEFLPVEINKSKYFGASHPFIAPDERYMIFDAGAADNNADLYISFRKKDGSWTDAVLFDQTINTEDNENIATVSPDGKYLFFGRDNDIYWVSAKIIEELRPKN